VKVIPRWKICGMRGLLTHVHWENPGRQRQSATSVNRFFMYRWFCADNIEEFLRPPFPGTPPGIAELVATFYLWITRGQEAIEASLFKKLLH
jgi:hypothetical protein